MRTIRNDQARRYALGAQGFIEGRADGRVDVRHFRKVISEIGLVQLDSVNVFSRTHYMPFFSRIGEYDVDALDDWLWNSGEVFEYWGHEASLIPVEHHRLFRWRMAQPFTWKRLKAIEEEHPEGAVQENPAGPRLQPLSLGPSDSRSPGRIYPARSKGGFASSRVMESIPPLTIATARSK